MALLTQAQAEAAYTNATILKIIDDADPTKGFWQVSFSLDGYDYVYNEADDSVLALDATDQQIKDKFIEIAKLHEYKGSLTKTYTTEEANKV